jgi:poly-gamma-glutamate synthesis protein (capsule biosynthesis protein)
MDYVTGKDGNQTLVIYSLGNFLSAQDDHENMLGGMASWTLSYNRTNGEVSFKNVEFLPTVTHIEGNFSFFRTYTLKDYTNELAARHTLTTQYHQDNTREYYINLVNRVMNDKVKIVY